MKLTTSLSIALAVAITGAQAWAASHDKHDGHHPAGAASAPAAKTPPGKAAPAMARMDTEMKAMREMHDKMMAAMMPMMMDRLPAAQVK